MKKETILAITVCCLLTFLVGCSKINESNQITLYKNLVSGKKVNIEKGNLYYKNSNINYPTENSEKGKFDLFDGIDSVKTFALSPKSTLTINVDSKIDNGEFKICLVNPEANKLIYTFDENKSESKTFSINENVTYRLWKAGNHASGNYTISWEIKNEKQ
jgi:hypothetical protein